MEWLSAVGHELHAWSLGLALVAVFSDSGPGMLRDHPPAARRVLGIASGVLAGLAFALLAFHTPVHLLLMVEAPFALLTGWYAWAWWTRQRAAVRRARGIEAAVVSGISLLVAMLAGGGSEWSGGLIMGAYGASAGLLGGLTALFLSRVLGTPAVTGPEGEQADGSVFGQAIAVGAGLMVLVLLEYGWSAAGMSEGALPPVGRWLLLSLVVPLTLVGSASKLAHRAAHWLRGAALLSAVAGQAAIHLILITGP